MGLSLGQQNPMNLEPLPSLRASERPGSRARCAALVARCWLSHSEHLWMQNISHQILEHATCIRNSTPCCIASETRNQNFRFDRLGPPVDPSNPAREVRQGMHTVVCPRLDRLARAPSHAMETRDKQHIGLEKFRAKRKRAKR